MEISQDIKWGEFYLKKKDQLLSRACKRQKDFF